ncbi:hypothetical protein [Streptomyces sp. NPDC058657]
MSRHTAPRCHSRRMKLDKVNGHYRCPVCKAWTTRVTDVLLAVVGGGAR